jgi:hypothetical protein
MTEAEVEVFPVVGYDDKGEQLKEPITYLTKDDLEVINRSRGTIKDPNGFCIVQEELTEEEFKKINITAFDKYTFPLPKQEWKTVFGRVKKICWREFEPDKNIYYDDEKKICYLHDLVKKKITKYSYKDTTPTDQELLEFQLKQGEYINFLKENDMDVVIKTEAEAMNTFKIIDRWSHTDKVDVFSRITPEERKNIILSRWIGAETWMPDIFTQIKGLLRLGHSIEEKGKFGVGGRRPLIEIQSRALERGRRTQEEDEQGAFDLREKR